MSILPERQIRVLRGQLLAARIFTQRLRQELNTTQTTLHDAEARLDRLEQRMKFALTEIERLKPVRLRPASGPIRQVFR